jgi:DNA-binding MurR/RpiR family transcriptional regulator
VAQSIFERLERDMESYSAAERAVANFLLVNRSTVAFETAASAAKKLGLSKVTVGRFIRKLGYQHFKALKADLRSEVRGIPWLAGDRLAAFLDRTNDQDQKRKNLQLEIEGIVGVYELSQTPVWRSVAALLASAKSVHVAGPRLLSTTFADMLNYVRTDVHLIDMGAANYADLFLSSTEGRCLVLIDTRRYSRQTYAMAKRAEADHVPLIMLVDNYCNWARKFTPNVLAASVESELFWDAFSPITSLFNLLVNDVIALRGADVEQRLKKMGELFDSFSGYV